jgi:hypothetical protein
MLGEKNALLTFNWFHEGKHGVALGGGHLG